MEYGVNGKTFQFVDSNRVDYIFYHSPVPLSYREATELEILDFQSRKLQVWQQIENNSGLAYLVMRKLGIPFHQHETLYHDIGIPTLLNAVRLHNPAVSKFSTYATNSLFNRFKSYLKGLPPELIPQQEPGERDPDIYAIKEETEFLLKTCSPAERDLLQYRFIDELTFEEIGCIIGCTRQQASIKINSLLERIRYENFIST